MSTDRNMETLRIFEVMSDKLDVVEICTSGNYAQNGSVNNIIVIL